MNYYQVGDLVRGSAAFTNGAGVAIDPSALTFRYRHEDGAETVYTYGDGTVLVRNATGCYHLDFSVGTAGLWFYRFAGTGTGQSAGEEAIYVQPSNF
jgi:hypothetical protein